MKIINQRFEMPLRGNLITDNIENHIKSNGYDILRWAIVKADDVNMYIEATLIKPDQ